MIGEQLVPDGVRLCTSCGLCCAGALHDTAALDEDEQDTARALGIPRAGGDFALPCPRLAGTRCTVLAERPRVCGRYRCGLLQEVEAGRTTLADALRKVRTASQLHAAVVRSLPVGATLPQVRSAWLGAGPMQQQPAPALRLQLAALTDYLDRHFRAPAEARLLRSEAADRSAA